HPSDGQPRSPALLRVHHRCRDSLHVLAGARRPPGVHRCGRKLMRLPGRLSAAIEVLEDIERRHRPASEALKAWGVNNRFAGAGDRAAIGNLVYDALRRRSSHAWAMGEGSPRALVLSVAVREWGETA